MLRALRWLAERSSILFFLLAPAGLVIGGGAFFIEHFFGEDATLEEVSTVGFVVFWASLLLWYLLRKLSDGLKWGMAQGVPKGDPANPKILYLRSFSLDRSAAGSFIGFEEALLAKLRTSVIAVANPGKAPTYNTYPGVQRLRLSERNYPGISAVDWQGSVEELIRRAEVVLIMFEDSAGVREEVSMAVRLGALEKTALVLPFEDYWHWVAALECLPDTVMRECLSRLEPSAEIISKFRRDLEKKIRDYRWSLSIKEGHFSIKQGRLSVEQKPTPRSRRPGEGRAWKKGFVADFRNSVEGARKTLAKERETGYGLRDPIVHLAEAGCPVEMLVLIDRLVSERVCGMTFAKHFHLWARPRVEDWGRDFGMLVEEMVQFLEGGAVPKDFRTALGG